MVEPQVRYPRTLFILSTVEIVMAMVFLIIMFVSAVLGLTLVA